MAFPKIVEYRGVKVPVDSWEEIGEVRALLEAERVEMRLRALEQVVQVQTLTEIVTTANATIDQLLAKSRAQPQAADAVDPHAEALESGPRA